MEEAIGEHLLEVIPSCWLPSARPEGLGGHQHGVCHPNTVSGVSVVVATFLDVANQWRLVLILMALRQPGGRGRAEVRPSSSWLLASGCPDQQGWAASSVFQQKPHVSLGSIRCQRCRWKTAIRSASFQEGLSYSTSRVCQQILYMGENACLLSHFSCSA